MIIFDALLVLLALTFAAPMLYGIWAGRQRAQGVEVASFGELLRDAWVAVAPVLRLLGWGARKVLAPARDHGPAPWHMSSATGRDGAGGVVVAPDNGLAKDPLHPIATPQNGNNDAIVVAALARLVASGELTQTAAIKTGLGVAPSSTSIRYAEVRNALRAEVERLKGADRPEFRLTEEQREWRRSMGLEEVA